MPIPTDRGYALVTELDDRTHRVDVCMGIEHDQPIDIFATHFRQSAVAVDPNVEVVQIDAQRFYTTDLVEVFLDSPCGSATPSSSDVVHIGRRPHRVGPEMPF
jgi:hypothetical protein